VLRRSAGCVDQLARISLMERDDLRHLARHERTRLALDGHALPLSSPGVRASLERTIAEHRAIHEALAARDGELAAARTAAHIDSAHQARTTAVFQTEGRVSLRTRTSHGFSCKRWPTGSSSCVSTSTADAGIVRVAFSHDQL